MNQHVTIKTLDWAETDAARQLLAELDAAERSADFWAGKGWDNVVESFSERCQEIELELDTLRSECVSAFADASSDDRHSDAWLDAWEDADDQAETVRDAAQRARRNHMGDELLRYAA